MSFQFAACQFCAVGGVQFQREFVADSAGNEFSRAATTAGNS